MGLGAFLIIEPDAHTAGVLATMCRRLRRARVVDNSAAALEILERRRPLTGLITEQTLPEGTGLDVIQKTRSLYPLLPCLLLTAKTQPEVINRAYTLRASFLAKPARRRHVRGFLREAVAFERVPDTRIAQVVNTVVEAWSLSPRETDILAAAVEGVPRKRLADQIGTTENTIKSCVKSLLRKCGHRNVELLVREIMHRALEGSADGPTEGARDSAPSIGPFTIPPPVDETGDERPVRESGTHAKTGTEDLT
ncbi:MAG: response regulator [Myxococcota bacterium]